MDELITKRIKLIWNTKEETYKQPQMEEEKNDAWPLYDDAPKDYKFKEQGEREDGRPI